MKKSRKAKAFCNIWVYCPYCEEEQNLMHLAYDGRLPSRLRVGESGTERTTNFKTYCFDCGEEFIVPRLEW
ncbi:MAG: hypothetical protein KAS32_08590 [Candidatus Peribacteraceae bacterium]|nr:hypothetical protein [Candidatus Peribacteraceae bacterium]